MLGAAALSGLAAMRSGAGLVTIGVPKSLNSTLQKKISPVIMTLPLAETPEKTLSSRAWRPVANEQHRYNVLAVGPGLGSHPSTKNLIMKIVTTADLPLVIDADALNALSGHLNCLKETPGTKILTPHPGEMARLLQIPKETVEANRKDIARDFSRKYKCVLLLKGARTVIASFDGEYAVNSTGNPGMATAGSGDVLTGMISAFLGQGLSAYEAAKWGAYIHGRAGDIAVSHKTRLSLIASDLIDFIPQAIQSLT